MKKVLLLTVFSILVLGCVVPEGTEQQIIPNIVFDELYTPLWFNVAEGGTASFRVNNLLGTIFNLSEGYVVTYSVNGIESTLSVENDGSFNQEVFLNHGENDIQVSISNGTHNLVSESFTVSGSGSSSGTDSALSVVLRWDNNNTEINLHVWDPLGRHTAMTSEDTMIPDTGILLGGLDDHGTQEFELEEAIVGDYTVKVRYFNNSVYPYNNSVEDPVQAWVYISMNEGTPVKYGPYTFTADMANGTDDSNDWLVATFSVPGASELVGCGAEGINDSLPVSIGDSMECENFGQTQSQSWYKLVLTNDTNKVNITTVSPANCDLLQLYLWNWENKQVDASAKSRGNEQIARNLENGTYYIELRQQTVLYCRFNDVTTSIDYY